MNTRLTLLLPLWGTRTRQHCSAASRISSKRIQSTLQERRFSETAHRAPGSLQAATQERLASPLDVEEALSEGRAAVLRNWPAANQVIQYHGSGTYLGIQGRWTMTFRPDGAFVEEFISPQLKTVSGHDGGRDSKCWVTDGASVTRYLDLDDSESSLLTAWVHLGLWLRPEARSFMHFSHETETETVRGIENLHQPDTPAESSGSQKGVTSTEDLQKISLQIRGHKICGVISLSQKSWQPISVDLKDARGERYEFGNWQLYEGCHWHPAVTVHMNSPGNTSTSNILGSKVLTHWDQLFLIPPIELTPQDTRFETAQGTTAPAWWTSSGHLMVEPLINGQKLGYMILDTGASGFVIQKEVADQLGMAKFGEYSLAGVMEQCKSCTRQSETLQLGPLIMEKPLWMEMEVSSLVTGGPGKTIGIIGYDLFRRAVMTIPKRQGLRSMTELKIHDPSNYVSDPSMESHWQTVKFVSNLPVIKATISIDSQKHDVQCMIDSGAGGVDLMFNARSTKRLNLLQSIKTTSRMLRGAGGSTRHSVQNGTLPALTISDVTHKELDCLFIGKAGLDISLYVDAIICNHILARCSTVLDYARGRIMMVHEDL